MIVYKTGNILDDDADWIVNPVNCNGVMGKGLAKQFKEKYPKYFEDYKTHCFNGNIQLGDYFVHWDKMGYSERKIISFPTKGHWRDNSDLNHIKQTLDVMAKHLRDLYDKEDDVWFDYVKSEWKSIAFPKIGTGLGGLDWDDVHELLKEFAEKVPEVEVRIYV